MAGNYAPGDRKVFGPRDPGAEASRGDAAAKKATPAGAVGRGADAGGIARLRSRSPFADEEKKSSSSSKGSRSGSKEFVDGKKGRRGDIDGKSPSKGRDADDRKTRLSAPTVTLEGTIFAELPKLRDTAPAEQPDLLRRKLWECATVYDFKLPDACLPEKEGKRQTLAELVDYVNTTTKSCFSSDETLMGEAVDMVSANIFRILTKRERSPLDMLDGEDEEPTVDPAWPHLEIVYEFLLRFVTSKDIDAAMAVRFVNQKLVLKLLELFDSDDPRERDCLRSIIIKISAKFSALRGTIRRAIQNMCLKAMTEKEVQNGMAELLEILARIISGFSTPLKDDNRDLLLRVLVPLHKVEYLSIFHSQLVDCVKKFTEKEPMLARHVILALLRFWPFSIAAKQILFISEMEDMLNVMPVSEFKRIQAPLGRRLAACLSFPNSDVAEKTLALWRSDRFAKMITQHCKEQFPVIISALYQNSTQHWHNSVHTRTFEVLKMLMDTDAGLFDSSSSKHRKDMEEEERKEAERERKWAILQALHDRKKAQPTRSSIRQPVNRRGSAAVAVPAPAAAEQSGGASASAAPRGAPSPRSTAAATAAATTAQGTTTMAPRSENDDRRQTSGIADMLRSASAGVARQGAPVRQNTRGTAGAPWGPSGSPGRSGAGREEWPLLRESCGISVSWDRGGADLEATLQALVVDARGRIIDTVHEQNPAALQALVLRPAGEQPGAAGEGGVIWLALSRLPDHVALIIFVVCAVAGSRLGDTAGRIIHVVEESGARELTHFPLERPAGDAGVVAVIRRTALRAWSLFRFEEFGKAGRHCMDILEPTVSKVLREVLPTLPRRHKAALYISPMAMGSVACLPHQSATRCLFVGLSWDLSPAAVGEGTGLVLAAVFFTAQGLQLGASCPDNLEAHGARHSGYGVLGQGLMLDLAAVPQEAVQVFVVGHLASRGTTFDLAQRPLCCIVDHSGLEMIRYAPALERPKEARAGEDPAPLVRGFAAGRFFRAEDPAGPGASARSNGSGGAGGGSRWGFQALGSQFTGDSWKHSLEEMQVLCLKPLEAFQSLPADIPAPGRCVVSL